MPELPDDMYCSQQIIVPPMFPYLLRQYAKAAIRSQPSDLLRWSTAYFRCLSLNLPPPVKPRLEYPVPKDYEGITPGWLRALMYQFLNSQHVDFKVLWDRWIGACMNHSTLIQILCLGGFKDPMFIPFLRFIALCVAHICENLTQTMIVICEVITEEPEGGSAMITLETFVDLYTFLANIDASKDQVLLNRYFPESLLDLLEKEKVKPPPSKAVSAEKIEREASVIAEEIEEEEKVEKEAADVISCPDLDDEPDVPSSEELAEESSSSTLLSDTARRPKPEVKEDVVEQEKSQSTSTTSSSEPDEEIRKKSMNIEEAEGEGEDEEEQVAEEIAEKAEDLSKTISGAIKEKSSIQVAVEPSVESDIDLKGIGSSEASASTIEEEEEVEHRVEEFTVEEIDVEIIPGIGGIVPKELVQAVIEYMKKCAANQHGMVMPRNIRHYTCPPLEVFD